MKKGVICQLLLLLLLLPVLGHLWAVYPDTPLLKTSVLCLDTCHFAPWPLIAFVSFCSLPPSTICLSVCPSILCYFSLLSFVYFIKNAIAHYIIAFKVWLVTQDALFIISDGGSKISMFN